MATITYTPYAAAPAERIAKPGFFSRLLNAMMESRMRRAQIEIRRAQAMVGEPKGKLDYALLPFAGE